MSQVWDRIFSVLCLIREKSKQFCGSEGHRFSMKACVSLCIPQFKTRKPTLILKSVFCFPAIINWECTSIALNFALALLATSPIGLT